MSLSEKATLVQAMKTLPEILIAHYELHGRDLPWRQAEADGTFSPYKILVSEIMLQQTQVDRVIPKYVAFIKQFPDVYTLAVASRADVLLAWSGLGYNRRAKFLHEAAKVIYQDEFPRTTEGLVALPGVGHNTAAAILTYAFDELHAFVETNVRTVYIQHYFADRLTVHDKEIYEVLESDMRLSGLSPRIFMWAVMDYGSMLKRQGNRIARRSKQYAKQTAFAGSKRQLRGEILRHLQTPKTLDALHTMIGDKRLETVLAELRDERLVSIQNGHYVLGD